LARRSVFQQAAKMWITILEKDGGIFKTSGCKIVFEGIYTLDYTDFNK
jgi:hypothetical protein